MTYYLTYNAKYEYIIIVCTKAAVKIYITHFLNVSTNYSKKTMFCLIKNILKCDYIC